MLKRRKVWLTILISYLFLLLLPVTVGGYIYQRMERVLAEQANKANTGLLEQARRNTDSRLTELNRILLQLSLEPNFKWLMDNAGNNHGEDQMHYVELMKELSGILNVNDYIDSLHLYFPKAGSVLTSGLKTDATLYYERIQRFEGIAESMPERLSRFHAKALYPVTTVNQIDYTKRVIPYVQTYPLDETGRPAAGLVMLINEQKMNSMLEPVEWAGEGAVYVLNEKQEILTGTAGAQSLPGDLRTRLAAQEGSFSYEEEGAALLVTSLSGENRLKYVSVVPEAIVMKKVDAVKYASLSLFGLYLLCGLALSLLLTYRSYKPVREVVRSILNRGSEYGEGAGNEYDFIQNAVIRSMNEEQTLRETLLKQMPAAKAHLLTRLLLGHTRPSERDPETLKMIGGSLDSRSFRVVLIEIENCQNFVKNDSEQEWALVRFVLTNLLEDSVSPGSFVVELGRNRLAVLLGGSPSGQDEEWGTWLEKLKPLVEQKFRIQFTAAVSSSHEGSEGIAECYTEALTALEYRLTQGSNSTIYYSHHKNQKRFSYYYPMENEVQIINYIKTSDYARAEQALDHVYEVNFVRNEISPELGRSLFQDITGTFLKVVHLLDSPNDGLENHFSTLAQAIAKCTTAEEMLALIKSGLKLLCDTVKEERSDNGQAVYRRIVEYIGQHYGDSNLSLTLLAEEFGFTAPYLSTFFKKQSGVNLSEYMTRCRIEAAKSLLTESDMTIGDISRQVGYANHIGFGRVFKKWEGITPGQYRETRGR
ncbi:helix-turn-helix domain-containing protein [Paenibacillus sp. CC-CFT747]|nr:helix-turn-helix domain-containing protein [Paenibacillus sp. CC-CFT747]